MISVPTNRRSPSATLAGWLAVALALALLAGAAGAASAASASSAQTAANETTLTVGDATVEPQANDTVRVSLDRAPDGLAGFEVTLVLESNATGSFTGARYPEDYQPTTDPVVGESGRAITLEAADLGSVVQSGATNVTLAYVSVTGSESGTAELTATDLQVDADGGSKVEPAVEAGTLSVGSAARAAGSGSAADGSGSAATGGQQDAGAAPGESDAPGGTPQMATGLQIGAVVAIAGLAGLALFVWRD